MWRMLNVKPNRLKNLRRLEDDDEPSPIWSLSSRWRFSLAFTIDVWSVYEVRLMNDLGGFADENAHRTSPGRTLHSYDWSESVVKKCQFTNRSYAKNLEAISIALLNIWCVSMCSFLLCVVVESRHLFLGTNPYRFNQSCLVVLYMASFKFVWIYYITLRYNVIIIIIYNSWKRFRCVTEFF